MSSSGLPQYRRNRRRNRVGEKRLPIAGDSCSMVQQGVYVERGRRVRVEYLPTVLLYYLGSRIVPSVRNRQNHRHGAVPVGSGSWVSQENRIVLVAWWSDGGYAAAEHLDLIAGAAATTDQTGPVAQ